MSAEHAVRQATTVEAKLEVIARELDLIALRVTADKRKEYPGDRPLESTDVRKVFAHWCKVMEKRPNTRLTTERRRSIQARLKAGYTVEYLCRAIDGCAASDFHMNRGKEATGKRFNDLTLIFRNDTKCEEFNEMAGPSSEEKREAFL